MRRRNVAPRIIPVNGRDPRRAEEQENRTLTWAICAALILTFIIVVYLFESTPPDFIPIPSTLPNASRVDAFDPHAWGTYRSHTYFGLRTKYPNSPLFGLMWYKQPIYEASSLGIRHTCKQEEGVQYMWKDADGKSFGHQDVIDKELKFETNWVGVDSSFSTEIRVLPSKGDIKGRKYAFVFYMLMTDEEAKMFVKRDASGVLIGYQGEAPGIGKFDLTFENEGSAIITNTSMHVPANFDPQKVDEFFQRFLWLNEDAFIDIKAKSFNENMSDAEPRNLFFVQFLVDDKSVIRANFNARNSLSKNAFKPLYTQKLNAFREEFDKKYELEQSQFPKSYKTMGRAALSNMLGSIGYWHGHSTVLIGGAVRLPYGPLTLVSAVPSRPFFPRGFLWDEGFHQLLIKQYDPVMSVDMVATWLDSIDSHGWIPREMILDTEAKARVPPEFIPQVPDVANPPVFFYLIESFMKTPDFMAHHSRRLVQLYPRLKLWYTWLRTSQAGPHKGTFRWRSRNATTNLELNPKTLPSGLDDFPRASHPSGEEYHLDLLCWMAMSSRVLRQIAEYASDTEFMPDIEADMTLFNDPENLDKWHWNEAKQRYFDFGSHSDTVSLISENQRDPATNGVITIKRRHVKTYPSLRHVDNVCGYVNLFPMLLRLLPPTSAKLGIMLNSLKDPKELWTEYGLRSLSTKSPYYMKYNTQHDGPYWRGPIWININYLALAALKHYSTVSGPHSAVATKLYTELRHNVITNIANQYQETGYFWEHYNDKTGKGGGSHPFTGWTALVLNIMAERYD
uniref:Mannosyl-oligosaccharide glucosidase n=1 Tax=Panagrellus redivivus TaxID=6233 RepID=A0A7E4WC93_PANRE